MLVLDKYYMQKTMDFEETAKMRDLLLVFGEKKANKEVVGSTFNQPKTA